MNNNYKNSFGEINPKEISITINKQKYTVKNESISKISFIKTQKYSLNYLIFILALLVLLYLKYNTFSQTMQLNLYLISFLFIIMSFYIKQFKYKFFLLKKNNFISFEITKSRRIDAENFVNHFNKNCPKTGSLIPQKK